MVFCIWYTVGSLLLGDRLDERPRPQYYAITEFALSATTLVSTGPPTAHERSLPFSVAVPFVGYIGPILLRPTVPIVPLHVEPVLLRFSKLVCLSIVWRFVSCTVEHEYAIVFVWHSQRLLHTNEGDGCAQMRIDAADETRTVPLQSRSAAVPRTRLQG